MPRYFTSVESALAEVMKHARRGLNNDVKNELEHIVKTNALKYGLDGKIHDGVQSEEGKSRIAIFVPLNLGHISILGSKKLGIDKGDEAVGLPLWIDIGRTPTIESAYLKGRTGNPADLEFEEARPFWTESVAKIKGDRVPVNILKAYLESQGFIVSK